MIAKIKIRVESSKPHDASFKKIFGDVGEGLRFINRHQFIFRIVQLNAVFSFLSSFFYITILNYSTTVLGLSPVGYGFLLACLGLGLCSGALLLGRKIGRLNFNNVLIAGFSLIALASFLFTTGPSFLVAIFFLVIAGCGGSLVLVTLDSLLQRMTPDSCRANIFGARGIVTNGVFLLSLIVVGKLLRVVSPLALFTVMGLASAMTACIIYISRGNLGYRIMRGILRLILKVFFKLSVEGEENIPCQGKVILAGNHTSVLDGIIVMAAYPRKVYFLVAESVFKMKFIGLLARQFGFIPIKRGKLNVEAMKEALRILQNHDTIGIFPEGKITDDEHLARGRRGVGIIAQRTNTPIIPFAIEGAYYAWPRLEKYPRRHPVKIRFGTKLDISEYEAPQGLVDELMHEIKDIKTAMEKESLFEVEPNIIVRHLINFE